MKIFGKIIQIFVKGVSIIVSILIAAIVVIMINELILRNVFNKSLRSSTELCGFLFMWMAFLGIVVLYDQEKLITLDALYAHVNESVRNVFWTIHKIVAIGLGIVMVLAYKGMYPINSTSYFSTMQWLSKTYNFLPMAIAGSFIAVKSVYQLLDHYGQKQHSPEKTDAELKTAKSREERS